MKKTTPRAALLLLSVAASSLWLVHCSSDDAVAPAAAPPAEDASVPLPEASTPPDAGVDAGPRAIPSALSGYGLFTGGPDAKGHLPPASGTVPYELTTALFSDYALKARTMTLPPGTSATYQPEAVLDFPVGTVFSKTFAFPADLRQPEASVRVIETRILIRQPAGWEAYPYVWNETQTEATLASGGRVVPVTLVDLEGTTQSFSYLVPSRNQCQQCHHLLDDAGQQVMTLIGPKARYLNRDHVLGGTLQNQLTYLANAGLLTGLPSNAPRAPDAFDVDAGTVEARARAYLDINCAHCHNVKGTSGVTSRLYLQHDTTDAFSLGVCKRPGSAGAGQGGEFDILPGSSAQSILWNRIHTTDSGKMMPQIGRALRHTEGSALVAAWIDAMPAQVCP